VVAIRNADRAGFGIMKYGEDEAHLLLLAVRPAHARCGVGRTLVDWLEGSARVAGIARISLEARFSNVDARISTAGSATARRSCCPVTTAAGKRACA
jgi:ribosomal-protein-alanine N-acetyltransferase